MPARCTVARCQAPPHGRGLCLRHYHQARRGTIPWPVASGRPDPASVPWLRELGRQIRAATVQLSRVADIVDRAVETTREE